MQIFERFSQILANIEKYVDNLYLNRQGGSVALNLSTKISRIRKFSNRKVKLFKCKVGINNFCQFDTYL